jgi:hypothetical protein
MGSIEIIVASIALLASSLSASLPYYFTKRNDRLLHQRKMKEEYYRAFIKALNDAVVDGYNRDALLRLSECFNSTILAGSSEVVQQLMNYFNFVRTDHNPLPKMQRDSVEWAYEHDKLLTKLIKEMRQDLFGKKYDKVEFPIIHLVSGGQKRQ